ncbi:DUF5671 domain-containing protein [Actinotalea sp. M2MS4P-6]|uniref:DUF5671 domain-containing protein n=1 Tax=Actinotalea sp. M2MS4P-6 TaxID=2983762 RepID=UPI0021E47EE5|nr:DUF5671 domain-containing protein [Actinotalea sp. M2MS4P-6]MCV2396478.1 DUF5671 domain-containing protein [Actinotalea sp. M2MS4P-6]
MTGLGIVSVLGTLAVPVLVVVLVVRAFSARREGRPGEGHGVRRFFQYLLLLGLLVVTLVGIVTIVSLAFSTDAMVDRGPDLARGLTFTVFGGGLLAAVVVWTRSTIRSDPGELGSTAWTIYLTFAELILSVVAAVYLAGLLGSALDGGGLEVEAAAGTVVWGVAWGVHWLLVGRTLDESRSLAMLVLGSLIGWVLGLIGLIGLLARALQLLLPTSSMVGPVTGGFGEMAGLLAAGAAIWVPHWALRLSRARTGPLWHGYVLVVGVGASLVVTLSGASVALYRLLVWVFGDAGAVSGAEYLGGTATPLAVALVGALSWWYHRTVLASRAAVERTEVTRVHDYLLAGVALGAAATGVALVVVALVDAIAPPMMVAGSVVNSVLAALTLLAVGGPLWWLFWRRVQRARDQDPIGEIGSPTRRIYLVLLFGVAGVVAVVVVLVTAFIILDDAIRGSIGEATLRDVRIPVGILLAAGAVSGYHWMVQREDRAAAPTLPVRHGPRLVLLVGPRDDGLALRIHESTGARVDGWAAAGPAWDVDEVLAALAPIDGGRVLLLAAPTGLLVVPDGASPMAGPVPPLPAVPPPSPAGPVPLPSGVDTEQHGDEPGPGGEQRQS